ncbi:hypothetical protein MCOR25_006666 [Pyricularia grisea]|uniref:Uncharacterized protein n=1 Tax=Pyricularia grisea TaxID=148305 RepID=A0A6P8B7X2_PYRGI|nr:hypothetical protein PgNI_06445 [Pyricularia grisea]KAI6360716.1 hypothetical protein MCOR25_006666 [Pyricularia grisea]TLD11417.1 hypothetical protein PgNI_06445 [Pyricularia grisea]
MHASTFFTLALATLASSAAVTSPPGTIEARFDAGTGLEARSELSRRACNCGSAFSCSGGVSSCCSSTGGYGMCNTDTNRCMCGTSCNPLQCSQRP